MNTKLKRSLLNSKKTMQYTDGSLNIQVAMKKKNNIKKYLKLISQIEKVRAKNNKNWMDLYRLSFASSPDKAVKIVKKIIKKDLLVSKLAKKLVK